MVAAVPEHDPEPVGAGLLAKNDDAVSLTIS
jgi:hypothetical protein